MHRTAPSLRNRLPILGVLGNVPGIPDPDPNAACGANTMGSAFAICSSMSSSLCDNARTQTFARKPLSNQPASSSDSLHLLFPDSFSPQQHALNLHRRFLTGGFFQTAVSDAPLVGDCACPTATVERARIIRLEVNRFRRSPGSHGRYRPYFDSPTPGL